MKSDEFVSPSRTDLLSFVLNRLIGNGFGHSFSEPILRTAPLPKGAAQASEMLAALQSLRPQPDGPGRVWCSGFRRANHANGSHDWELAC